MRRDRALLAGSVAALLFLNTLPNGIVFDDHRAIARNPMLQTSGGWSELADAHFWRSLFTTDFWGTPLKLARSHRSYRPLSVLSLRIDAQLIASIRQSDGVDAAISMVHAVNAALHGFNVWLLWLHARAGLRGRAAPLAAALLFGAHPLNTEAVAYGVGRADLLAAALGLAALRLHASRRYLTTFICLLLALAAKETAIVLLPLCAASDLLLAPSRPRGRILLAWSPLLVLLLGYVWLRVAFVGSVGHNFRRLDNPIAFTNTTLSRYLSCARVHYLSFRLLVWPATLSADYSYDAVPIVTSLSDDAVPSAIALYLLLIGTTLWLLRLSLRRNASLSRAALFWMMLLAFSYAPASHILVPLSFVVAERLLYMPCAATSLLAAALISTTSHHKRTHWLRRLLVRLLLCAALVVGCARTMVRNLDWKDDTTLFTAASAAYPRSAKAQYQLADRLMQKGEVDEGIIRLHKVLEIEPNYHYAYLHLGKIALERDGDLKASYQYAAASLRAVPAPNPDGHAIAARALLELSRQNLDATAAKDEGNPISRAAAAAEHAQAAYDFDPNSLDATTHLATLGEALTLQKKWKEAAKAFSLALKRKPSNPHVTVNYAACLLQLQKGDKAAELFRKALAMGGGSDPRLMEKARKGLELAIGTKT